MTEEKRKKNRGKRKAEKWVLAGATRREDNIEI